MQLIQVSRIWWDSHKLLTESKPTFETNTYENKTLFLAIANRMEKGVDTTAVQADTSEQTELIRYTLALPSTTGPKQTPL